MTPADDRPSERGASGRGFLGRSVSDLRAVTTPGWPAVAAAVYCFVMLAPYYHPDLFSPGGGPGNGARARAVEGAWYLAVPILLVAMLAVVRSLRRRRWPPIGRGDLRLTGCGWGTREGWRDALILFCLVLPILVTAALLKSFRTTYPLAPIARSGLRGLLIWQASHLLYMLGWEFIHRGWLLFGLERVMGRWAVLVVAVPFALLHAGKPELEAYASFLAAFPLGWLALRSRSFLPAAALHWAAAAAFDVLVIIRTGGFG